MIFCYCKSPLAQNLFVLNRNMQPNNVCLGVQLSRSVSFFGEILAPWDKKIQCQGFFGKIYVPKLPHFWEKIFNSEVAIFREYIAKANKILEHFYFPLRPRVAKFGAFLSRMITNPPNLMHKNLKERNPAHQYDAWNQELSIC